MGPTGIGKTELAISMARQINTEIISCDSRQFYREMSIGTAIPSPGELALVKHHFIGHISIHDTYSSNHFEHDVLNLLPSLFNKYGVALMVGGSGLYIDAVTRGIDEMPGVDPEIRKYYTRKFDEEGIEGLRAELKIVDPGYYAVADLRNHKRIIRALETTASAGKPYSSFLKKEYTMRDFRVIKVGLNCDRGELFERINSRVDRMVGAGLEGEARSLYEYRHLNALKTVGYREFFDFFDGIHSREKAIELVKRNSRHYARRQVTWFGRYDDITWFERDDREGIDKFLGPQLR